MIRSGFVLLAALFAVAPATAQTPDITAQSLPVIAEPSWTFSDSGNTYLVGKASGKVTVIRGTTVTPVTPGEDKPTPPPPVIQPVTGAAWFSVITDELKPDQAAWRTDAELRASLAAKKIQFRSYISQETELDAMGFRPLVAQHGLPLVIVQDANGKLLKTISPKNKNDITALVDLLKSGGEADGR